MAHRHVCAYCDTVFDCPAPECDDDDMDMYPTDGCPTCLTEEELSQCQ